MPSLGTTRLQELRELAGAASGSILLETAQPAPGEQARTFLFQKPLQLLEARTLDELPGVFAEIEAAHAQGLWLAGYLGYECGYHFEPLACPGYKVEPGSLPLAAFGVYTSPLRWEAGDAAVAPVSASLISGSPIPIPSSPDAGPLAFDLDRDTFTEKISAIHRLIEAGDTYQANLTGRVHGAWPGSAAELFSDMMVAQPVAFGALLSLGGTHILSASPELFFHLHGRQIRVCPMKGTAPRGSTPAEDAWLSAELAADAKNCAENLMIVDLLRSDLGRIAEAGSVKVEELFSIQQLPSLLQMTSTISATLQPKVDFYALFRALFPSGSIVGAPKVRTMQILRALERRDRGVYTGAIGYIAPHGEAMFSVAIRTAVLQHGRLMMGVGAGITYDSDPAAEHDECLLKASFLNRILDKRGCNIDRDIQLIETMRWENGGCALLERHLDRLERSAGHFSFRFDREAVSQAILKHGAALDLKTSNASISSATAWKLRLTLNRDGELTFSQPEPLAPPTTPLRCTLWPHRMQAAGIFLRHKTTHRAVYDAAVRAARAEGFVDALFLNEVGMLTEGAIHNIFLRHGNQWSTPPLTAGVLPGVYRAHLLATLACVDERSVTLDDLFAADEIWLTNAVHGARTVHVTPESFQLTAHLENSAIVRS
jgi:para-aminobenzoate synthetase/4-amino-4-deoxychorismate lyase